MSQDMLGIAVRRLVTLPTEILGIVCDLLEKLSNPEWVQATKRFLRKENPWEIAKLKIWKTIKLGMHKDVDEIRKSLKTNRCNTGNRADDILGKIKISETEEEVNLVVTTVKELGFKNDACYADICKRAHELGLELCPAEVGPQLRLWYKNQPKCEWLVIAMEAISASDGNLLVFLVGRYDGSGGSWLDSCHGYANYVWNNDSRFVFVSRM